MDARLYFELTDAILAAPTPTALHEIESRIQAVAMHPVERQALARVLRSRADALAAAEAILVGRSLAHSLIRPAVA
jgi:hypothetical protein